MVNAFGGNALLTKPPEKGSFPLDHRGECKDEMKSFMQCLKDQNGAQGPCKKYSRIYLQCRIKKGLMQQENLDKLGLAVIPNGSVTAKSTNELEGKKEAEGFLAGLGVKQERYK